MMRTERVGRQMWSGVLGVVLGVLIVCTGTPAIAAEGQGTGSKAALEATSWLLTVPYGAFKCAYAIGGGIVGGIAWAVTGGDKASANSIWVPAVTGDYIIRPENLTGERPLHFVGKGN
ncbi:MAG TPA: hypothetical protein VFX56_07310 [Nitrospira sp.]|nr:hypothetical protein [Nitrospira sp.]